MRCCLMGKTSLKTRFLSPLLLGSNCKMH